MARLLDVGSADGPSGRRGRRGRAAWTLQRHDPLCLHDGSDAVSLGHADRRTSTEAFGDLQLPWKSAQDSGSPWSWTSFRTRRPTPELEAASPRRSSSSKIRPAFASAPSSTPLARSRASHVAALSSTLAAARRDGFWGGSLRGFEQLRAHKVTPDLAREFCAPDHLGPVIRASRSGHPRSCVCTQFHNDFTAPEPQMVGTAVGRRMHYNIPRHNDLILNRNFGTPGGETERWAT